MFKSRKFGFRQESFDSTTPIGEMEPNTSRYFDHTIDLTPEQELQSELTDLRNSSKENGEIEKSERNLQKSSSNDCICPPWCFTKPITILIVSITFLLLTIAIIIINLTIHGLAKRREHQIYYHNPSQTDQPNDIYFLLHGTPESYETFEPIPYSEKRLIRTLELTYVNVNITELFYNFRYSDWNKLENLTLTNIRFSGRMPWHFNDIPYPPSNLKNFVLDINLPIGQDMSYPPFIIDLCDQCTGGDQPRRPNISGMAAPECLSALTFFKKSSGSIIDLKFNIRIVLWGLTYLDLNYDKRSFISMVPYAENLLRELHTSTRLGNGLQHLSLRDITLDLNVLEPFTPTLVEVHFDTVRLKGAGETTLSSFLSKCNRLEQLTLKFGEGVGPITSTPKPIPGLPIIHLADLTLTLKNLSLTHVVIGKLPTNSTQKFKLDLLNLNQVGEINQLLFKFPEIFEIRRFAWRASSSQFPYFNELKGWDADWVLEDSGNVLNFTRVDPKLPWGKTNVEIEQTVRSPRLIWFNLLGMDKFIHKDLAQEPIW